MAWSRTQKYLAEFLGTFALLLFGGGAAVFSLGAVPGLGINYPVAGFGEPFARVVLVASAFGFVVLGLAYAFGDVSGGHFNPAVTLSMALSRRMPLGDVVPYLVAQVLGGLIGIAVVLGIASGSAPSLDLAQAAALGSQSYQNPGPGAFSLGAVFLIETALTFVFVLVIQLVTRPANTSKNLAPVAIGLTLLVTNLVAIPVDGASINPVRSFAPALLSYQWSGAHWALQESWLFWVAPIVGGLLAALVEMALRPKP